jgi:hypothetical protein
MHINSAAFLSFVLSLPTPTTSTTKKYDLLPRENQKKESEKEDNDKSSSINWSDLEMQ